MLDHALDHEDIAPVRPSFCERETALVVAHIRQAFEDADRIGRGVQVTGEGGRPKAELNKLEHYRRDLIDWMYRDASAGHASLAYCCNVVSARLDEPLKPEDVRNVILLALDGETPPLLLDWRSTNVTRTQAHTSAFCQRSSQARSARRERRLRERARRRDAAIGATGVAA
jgi:hypothetical protein